MNSPEEIVEIPFSKGAADESMILVHGASFEPINDTERIAAEQDANAKQYTKAEWAAIVKSLSATEEEISPEQIHRYTGLPPEDAEKIFQGLRARKMLERKEPPKGLFKRRQLGKLALTSTPTEEPDGSNGGWGVIIVDHEKNGVDTRLRKSEPRRYPTRKIGDSTPVPDDRDDEVRRQEQNQSESSDDNEE